MRSANTRLVPLSFADGAFAALTAIFGDVIAITYLSLQHLNGASFGLLCSVPVAIGAASQAVIPMALAKRSTKAIVLIHVALQIIGLGAMAASVHLGSVWLMAVALTLYYVGSMTATGPWQQWLTGLVGTVSCNRFFANRQSFVSLVTFLGILVSAFLIGKKAEHAAGLLLAGAAFRLFSFACLATHPRGEPVRPAARPKKLWAWRSEEGSGARLFSLCALGFAFRAAANVSSPFVLPYLLVGLNMTVVTHTLLTAVPLVARVFVMGNWGKLLDERRLYEGFFLCLTAIAAMPSLWALSGSLAYLSVVQLLSGVAWGGFELLNVMMIQRLFPRHIMAALGLYLAAGSLGGVAGSLVGGLLLDHGVSYHGVFYFGSFLRFSAALGLLVYLRGKREFRFRLLELRAGMATVLRPSPVVAVLEPVRRFRKAANAETQRANAS